MSNKRKISVLIVNYFSEHNVRRLVDSMEPLGSEIEVVIVDNSGSLGNIVSELVCIRNVTHDGGNVGFGRAMNMAADAAIGDVLFLVNPDIILTESNVIIKLADRLRSAEGEVGAVSCALRYEDGSVQSCAITGSIPGKLEFLNMQVRLAISLVAKKIVGNSEKKAETPGALAKGDVIGFYGAFFAIRRDAFKSVGGFDPDFFMYCEDTEFFRRRFSKSWRCSIYNDLEVTHVGRASDVHGIMKLQNSVSFLLYLRKCSLVHMATYAALGLMRYSMLYFTLRHRDEAIRFFISLSYLPRILPRHGVGNSELPPLKIRQVLD